MSKGEKKADVRFPAVKVTTPPKGPAVEVHSDEDEIVPTFQDSFVDALAQATENMQIASQGIHYVSMLSPTLPPPWYRPCRVLARVLNLKLHPRIG